MIQIIFGDNYKCKPHLISRNLQSVFSLRAKYFPEHWNIRKEDAADAKPSFFFALNVVTCHMNRTEALR